MFVAFHQNVVNLICFYFVNSPQSYDCNNSDYN